MKFNHFTINVIIRIRPITQYVFGTCTCTQDLQGICSLLQGNTTVGGAGDRSKNMCCRLTLTCHSWKDCKRELSGLHTDMETRTYSRRHSGGNIMKVNNTGNLTTVEEVMNLLSASRIKKYLRYFANISNIHQIFLYKPSTVNLHKFWPESHCLI